MASLEWIKLTCNLHAKSQVLRIRRALKLRTVDEVVGKLCRLWAHFENHSKRGSIPGLVAADLDELCGKKGFAAAVVAVGWLALDETGASIPAYDEYMGAASRSRDADAERKRIDRNADTTRTPTGHKPDTTRTPTGHEPDRNRTSETETDTEGKSKNPLPPPGESGPDPDTTRTQPGRKPDAVRNRPRKSPPIVAGPESVPIPQVLDTEGFRAAWAEWVAERKSRGKRQELTAAAAVKQLLLLTQFGPEVAIAAINMSIASGWQGLFPEKPAQQHGTAGGFATKGERQDAYMMDQLDLEGIP